VRTHTSFLLIVCLFFVLRPQLTHSLVGRPLHGSDVLVTSHRQPYVHRDDVVMTSQRHEPPVEYRGGRRLLFVSEPCRQQTDHVMSLAIVPRSIPDYEVVPLCPPLMTSSQQQHQYSLTEPGNNSKAFLDRFLIGYEFVSSLRLAYAYVLLLGGVRGGGGGRGGRNVSYYTISLLFEKALTYTIYIYNHDFKPSIRP